MKPITSSLGADLEPLQRGLEKGQARRRAAKAQSAPEPPVELVDPMSLATSFTVADWPE